MLHHALKETPNNPKNTICAEATPQLYNLNALLGRLFERYHLSAPESSRPCTCVRIPQGYLSPFPDTSSLSYPLPFTSHPPLTHLILRGNVRPLLHQETHHRIMPPLRSDEQRRVSILRRAPPASATHPYAPPGPRPHTPHCVQTAMLQLAGGVYTPPAPVSGPEVSFCHVPQDQAPREAKLGVSSLFE